jgi:hypothetical protein
LYKGNTALLRGIESVVPSTSSYRQDQISAATPNKSKLPLHMSKGPIDIIKFLENTSKTSSINSPVLNNRNALKDKDAFKTVSHTDSATRKYRSDFMNYVKPISDVSPERYIHTQEGESKKQSLYQGGFVEETDEGKQVDQEYTEFVESEEVMADLPERGNKAESVNGSYADHDDIIKEEVTYDILDQSDSNAVIDDEEASIFNKHDIDTNKKLTSTYPTQPTNRKYEEEKVNYRGRGLKNPMKVPKIPNELHNIQGKEITPESFEIHSLLGKGAFGKVYLVTKKDTGKQYAMKVLSKETIIKSKITRYALTEKNIMSRIPHPFIVGLHYAFQTNDFLYLILDLCSQGNMGDHLDAVNNIDEQNSKYYA